ncbi:carbon monoxide dehydrogenase G protein [Paramagnetospirillum magnetotacticum MS-1]|uniref:Carbon monoxide dehydrogenase G protein n=1 Tax=Paramagnetospirillum magnetotacticum MS-1 TaxID=272627 RepID=A0A0C2UA89_PARME|nr:carbon monoxide dehydrogenase subunit G [Paramagnetospirillum magnetotacticum]KIL98397.1 carbon monoxide dehydrogenase G protein [Paramagnetospirillum magnetotacticum MS-1]
MDFDGEHRIGATRAQVWQALNDPIILAACIPGCETLEATGPGTYTATVALRVGALAARFTGLLSLTDVEEARAYTLTGQGQGGVAGFVSGSARVVLEDDGDATILRWTATGEIGGRLASVGGRLLHGFAAKTANQFFSRMNDKLGSQPDCGSM